MYPSRKSVHPVRASAILTTSYVAGTVVSMDNQNYIGILVEFTKGSLTSLEVKVESSIDGGTTFGQQQTESASNGTVTSDGAFYQYDTTGNYWIVINPLLADQVKISAKGTGTVTSSSLKLTAVTGWV